MVNPAVLTWPRAVAATGPSEGARTYVWNPDGTSSELDGDANVLRTNLARNPSVETNTEYWEPYSSSEHDLSRSTTESWVGSSSLQIIFGDTINRFGLKNPLDIATSTTGETYTIQMRVKPDPASADTGFAMFVQPGVQGQAGRTRTPLTDGWELVSTNFVAASAFDILHLYFNTIDPAGTWHFDGFHIHAGATPIGDYFDGDTPNIT